MILFRAVLHQLTALADETKSYAEGLFDVPSVGALDRAAATQAIADPIHDVGASISEGTMEEIVRVTEGYPYFLQEWAKHTWQQASGPEINMNDVLAATETTSNALDSNFFRVRFDRLTPREQGYLNALAQLGPGLHRSCAIAEVMGLKVEHAGPLAMALSARGWPGASPTA